MKEFKTGQKAYEITDDGINEHVIFHVSIIAGSTFLLIDGKFRPAEDYHSSLRAAMDAQEGQFFKMFR